MEARPGTYVLLIRSDREKSVRVGRLGAMQLRIGTYAYVGSAFGPGGVLARVRRHLKRNNRPHWHIDAVLREAHVFEVWYSYDHVKREEEWARALASMPETTIPLKGFGASDCQCEGHLFYFNDGDDVNHSQVFSSFRSLCPSSPIHRVLHAETVVREA